MLGSVLFEEKTKQGLSAKRNELVLKQKELEKNNELIVSELNGLNEQLKRLVYDFSACESKIKQLNKSLEDLSKADKKCPVCRREMDEHLTKSVKEEVLSELNDLVIEKNRLKKEQSKIEDLAHAKQNLLDKNKKELEDFRLLFEKIDRAVKDIELVDLKKSELRTAIKQIEEVDCLIKGLMKEVNVDELKELDARQKFLEQTVEAILVKNKLEEKSRNLAVLLNELDGLAFDEKEFELKKESFFREQSKLEAEKKDLKSLNEFINQVESELNRFIEVKKLIDLKLQEISSMEKLVEKLGIFVNALVATQGELRKTMIDAINQAMNDIWPRIYPYGDFLGAELKIVDSNYELMVLNRNKVWSKIDGVLSGGERMAVALTLRIAVSLVLTQNLGLLILDEPTHNLDARSVSELSVLVREHLPSLVEQLFVITHDKEMEKAASSYLYFFEREKELDGPTKVLLQQIE